MSKKILKSLGIFALIALVALSIWYFSKPYDYKVTFQTKALPGTINQSLKLWVKSLKNSDVVESKALENIKQKFKYKDDTYIYNWTFESKNDSITNVSVDIMDSLSTTKKRIATIFKDTKIKTRAIKNIKDFVDVLNAHLDSHDVKIVGEEMSPEVYLAYLSFETEQMLKANEMMKSYTYLSNELLKNKVELDGNPMVEITKWDTEKDSIHFNFCFPVVYQDSLPAHPEIKYKKIESQKSLKAIYHGNYISSDRGWYRLLHYAEKNNLNLAKSPLEVYHNNPNYGSDERNWKTEIYMPLKE